MDFEDGGPGVGPGTEVAQIHPRLLQQAVPGLDTHVVPTVALPTPARGQAVARQPGLVGVGGLRAAAVRVV